MLIRDGTSMQSEYINMDILAVTGIGSNDGKCSGVSYAYLFSAYIYIIIHSCSMLQVYPAH